jgi:hypothetical protein
MAIQPSQKLQSEPISRARGATSRDLEQTAAKPALLPERPRLQRLEIPKPDVSTAALEARLVNAVKSRDPDFFRGMLHQLIAAGELGHESDDLEVNFLLSVIEGIEPRDIVDAMLAAQMSLVHVQVVRFARRLNRVVSSEDRDNVANTFNKLTRTFATQVEALTRYRTGGGRNFTVGHVSVSEGGRAIVGNVTQGQHGAASDEAAPSPPLLVDAKTVAMPEVEGNLERVPVPLSRAQREKSRPVDKE